MHNIDLHIAEFSNEITKIGTENIAIGGSFALMLHGLEIGHEPEDLDLIIFKPTDEQYEFIANKCESNANYQTVDGGQARSWKLKRKGMTLNIIFAFDVDVPENPLFYVFGKMYRVNPIADIIKAKLQYTEGHEKQNLRRKDMMHLQMLKNLNFNIVDNQLPVFKPEVVSELSDLLF